MIVFMANVSVSEAARRLGVGVPRIHQRIADGSLRAERIGSQWVVDELSMLRIAERSDPGRPLSPRSAWALIAVSVDDAEALELLAPVERSRARQRLDRLLESVDAKPGGEKAMQAVAASLRSLLRNRAERRVFQAAAPDIEDLRADSRWQSLVSSADSGIASNDVEGYVDSVAAASLIKGFLLSDAGDGGNVIVHIVSGDYRAYPESKLQLAADLAEHRGPREEARAVELLCEMAEQRKAIRP